MTLQEAVKSGLRFKRPSHDCFFAENGGYVDNYSPRGELDGGYVLTTEDIMATDWELEVRISLSADDIERARLATSQAKIKDKSKRWDYFTKRLGFK